MTLPKAVEQRGVEDIVQQRGLPGPGYAGDGGETPQGEGDVDSLQLVLPGAPGPGPRSTMKSAALRVCSSCSTTTRVLPRSRNRRRVSIKRALSRWWRPMVGSSRMYSTPTRDEPICG